MAAWMGLARRWRHPPAGLPALLAQWKAELQALDAATDPVALQAALARADVHWRAEAQRVSAARLAAAGPLGQAVTQAMQSLGMAGGRLDVVLTPLAQPQAQGLEAVELHVAGHAGSTPRPLAKVASGGELSRLALAIAVCTAPGDGSTVTLIFDEIDAGIGGAVGDTVGALLKQLGTRSQVLAVTHLAQVAACGDQHYVVSKALQADGRTASSVATVTGEARVAEVARMLGGEHMAHTSLAHAQAMLQAGPAQARPRSKA
jgi:DNA repair protein RecN (Recombination protein N)